MTTILGSSKLQKLEEIKKELRSILIALGNKNVTLKMLKDAFHELVEEDIPYKFFSFTSLREFLMSMPDVVDLKFDEKSNEIFLQPIQTEKSKHISDLVAREKEKKFVSSKEKFYFDIIKNNLTDPNLVIKILEEYRNSSPRSQKIRKAEFLDKIKKEIGFYNFYNEDSLHNQCQELSHVIYYDDEYIYFKNEVQSKQTKAPVIKNKREFSKTIKLNSASDLIKIKTKSRLAELIHKHKKIWCTELPQVYRKEFRLDLEYTSLGFNSIIEFISCLPDIFSIFNEPGSGRTFVVERSKSELYIEIIKKGHASVKKVWSQLPEISSEALPPKLVNKTLVRVFIPNYVSSFCDIDTIRVSKLSLNRSQSVDIIVSDVKNPSLFWVTLHRNKSIIKDMMQQLHIFYNDQDMTKYTIPSLAVKPGLHVACKFAGMWHRGLIRKIKPEDLLVYFYDYGTLKTYKLNEVYFLDLRFSTVPVQAIPCSLYNVKPISSNKWSRDSSKRFMDLVMNKQFTANVIKRNDEENSVEIELNCTKNEWVCINKLLLQENLAEHGRVVDNIKYKAFNFQIHQLLTKEKVDLPIAQNNTVEESLAEKIIDDSNRLIRPMRKLEIIKNFNLKRFSSEAKTFNDSLQSESSTASENCKSSSSEKSYFDCKESSHSSKSSVKSKSSLHSNLDLTNISYDDSTSNYISCEDSIQDSFKSCESSPKGKDISPNLMFNSRDDVVNDLSSRIILKPKHSEEENSSLTKIVLHRHDVNDLSNGKLLKTKQSQDENVNLTEIHPDKILKKDGCERSSEENEKPFNLTFKSGDNNMTNNLSARQILKKKQSRDKDLNLNEIDLDKTLKELGKLILTKR